MSRVVLITGGNLGNVVQNLTSARREIELEIGQIVAFSSIHYSEAWGFESKELFANQVVVVETSLSAEDILEQIWRIEALLGRDREQEKIIKASGERYTSRTMDIDIIFYDQQMIQTPRLVVPHPLFSEREFVLRPLAEVLPDYVDPRSGLSVKELLREFSKKNSTFTADMPKGI